jgi:integrase
MARPAKGHIEEHRNAAGRITRSLRFHSGGQRHRLPLGEVSHDEAQRQLSYVLADVARGTWRPAEPAPAAPEVPTFHEFAETWWALNERQWAPKTRRDYRWKLEEHLIPAFGERFLSEITISDVERYAADKLDENERIREAAAKGEPVMQKITDRNGRTFERHAQPLSPPSLNATISLLGQILDAAMDRDLVPKNVARGRGRKVRERSPARSYLETAGQIEALLSAAGRLDAEARVDCQHIERKAMLATLAFAGLRIGELCALRWRDVDLAAGWLTFGESKTDAGRRRVKIRGALRDELLTVRAKLNGIDQDAFVFATRRGGRPTGEKIRSRVLSACVKNANADLARRDLPPLPEKLTPHSLLRTFASLLYALGEDAPVVMAEMGHTDPALALRIYAQAMRRGQEERATLAALVEGVGFSPGAGLNPVGTPANSGDV